MKLKSSLFTAILLAGVFSHASSLIISSPDNTTTVTEKTTLTYNLLMVDQTKKGLCFNGDPKRIEGLINKMISNSSNATNVKLELFQISDDNELIKFGLSNNRESYQDSSRLITRDVKKCVVD